MLVLLIIFMVTAPLMTSGVSVDLPKTDAKPLNTDSQPLTVSIDADGQDLPAGPGGATAAIWSPSCRRSRRTIQDRRIFVRGDKDLAYGRIMEVMGTITQGGFTKVALLAEQPAHRPPAKPAAPASPLRPPEHGARPAPAASKAG